MKILIVPGKTERASLCAEDVSFIDDKKYKVVFATIDATEFDLNLFFYQIKFANTLGLLGYRTDALFHTFYVQDGDDVHRCIVTTVENKTAFVWYKNKVFLGDLKLSDEGIAVQTTEIIANSNSYTPLRLS